VNGIYHFNPLNVYKLKGLFCNQYSMLSVVNTCLTLNTVLSCGIDSMTTITIRESSSTVNGYELCTLTSQVDVANDNIEINCHRRADLVVMEIKWIDITLVMGCGNLSI
jgi:hypothetical protein